MAGIYIHIPFCRQACHYCDFHFSTNLSRQDEMIAAINQEITQRKDFVSEEIQTIYFGGGTPSLLTPSQIKSLLESIHVHFRVVSKPEVTLEANPEDLSLQHTKAIHDLGVNRLSIGIQTFDEAKLKWMNRIHSRNESIIAFDNAREAGFKNISLDLIYAIPDHQAWGKDLEQIVRLNPEHISLYGLTIEDKTVFGKWERDRKLKQVSEGAAAEQYLHSVELLKENGFEQYEVSNFGKAGFYSRHNNAYWSGAPYLGVGPGAHSFDGAFTRQFNVSNNAKYLKAVSVGESFSEQEILSETQRINERILTELRTRAGINVREIERLSGRKLVELHAEFVEEMIHENLVEYSAEHLRLKPKGFLVADEIALRLFFPE